MLTRPCLRLPHDHAVLCCILQAVPVLYNQLGQLTPSDLLDLLSAYATAASHSPTAYSHELFAALTEFLWEGLSELDTRELADIAACYAAVDHYDDDEDFFGGVAAAALHKLEVRLQYSSGINSSGLTGVCRRCLQLIQHCCETLALVLIVAHMPLWLNACSSACSWGLCSVDVGVGDAVRRPSVQTTCPGCCWA